MNIYLCRNDLLSDVVGILTSVLGFTSVVSKAGLTLCTLFYRAE